MGREGEYAHRQRGCGAYARGHKWRSTLAPHQREQRPLLPSCPARRQLERHRLQDGGYVTLNLTLSPNCSWLRASVTTSSRSSLEAGTFNLNTLPYNRAPEEMMGIGEGTSDSVAMGDMDMDGMEMGGSSMDGINMGDMSQEGSTDTSMDGMNMGGSESITTMQTGVQRTNALAEARGLPTKRVPRPHRTQAYKSPQLGRRQHAPPHRPYRGHDEPGVLHQRSTL